MFQNWRKILLLIVRKLKIGNQENILTKKKKKKRPAQLSWERFKGEKLIPENEVNFL